MEWRRVIVGVMINVITDAGRSGQRRSPV